MIAKTDRGYTATIPRPDGGICVRRFAGLNAARRFVQAVHAAGVIPEGKPYSVRFYGSGRTAPLRGWDSGLETYNRETAGELAEIQFPGLWSEVYC